MSLRSFSKWLFLLTTLALVFAGCGALGSGEPRTRTELVTVVVIVTATQDPNSTPSIMVVTATPDRTQVSIPDGLVPTSDGTNPAPQTFNTTPVDSAVSAQSASNVPAGCIVHTIDTGDTPFGLALEYGVDPFLMLSANGLDEESATRLRIGDTLIIPVVGCAVEQIAPPATATLEVVETATPTQSAEATDEAADVTPTIGASPTITLEPTARNAQVEIAGLVSAGDITAEGVRIRNTGSNIRITGWTLTDLDGNEYVFGDQIMFSSSELTLYSRTGPDTPVQRFWGLDEAVWQPGDVVTLRDTDGNVQATFRVPQDVDLP